MASINTTKAQVTRQAGNPPHTRQLDLLMGFLSVLLVSGLFIDGWAHNRGIVDETFFTPYHFVMYASYALFGLTLVVMHYRNVGKGYRFMSALPKGYMISLIGVFIFGSGGFGDMIWHTFFGIEDGIEALYSPTHLVLGIGYVTVLAGILQSYWVRPEPVSGWRDLAPVLIIATCILSILTFFTQHLHFVSNFEGILNRPIGYDNQEAITTAVMSSYIIVSALMVGTLLFLMRRWKLPVGAITFVLTLDSILMGLMLIFDTELDFMTILLLMSLIAAPTLLSGIVGDVLIWRLKITQHTPDKIRIVVTVIGALLSILYLAAIAILGVMEDSRFWWEIHTWAGIPTLAAIGAFLLSYLVFPPQIPQEQDDLR